MCSNHDAHINALIDCLNGRDTQQRMDANGRLHELLGDRLPRYLLLRYHTQKHWQSRHDYVYQAQIYARRSEDAIALGKLAVSDRSKEVRFRACALLAYSSRRDLLPFLQEKLEKAKDPETREDIIAAMDAITEQNHHYFMDRDHSGKLKWYVE